MVLLAATKVDLIPDGTLFIHIGLILLMIYILNRTFFRPVNRVLEAREKNKGGQFGESEKLLKDVAEKETQYQEALRDARTKGYELIETERAAALALKAETLTTAKSEIQSKFTNDLLALEKQTGDARGSIALEAQKMADKISANILKG
jgi:F0F1-type ATP synthase membrane subunit b/b'